MKGCPICIHEEIRLKNEKKFFEEVYKIHGDRYTFEHTKYIDRRHKIDVTCKIHGVFSLNSQIFKDGSSCKKCYHDTMRKSREKFIEESIEKHGNKYDYSNVKYFNTETKVTIICPKHNEFEISPNNHIKGAGCQECAGYKRLTTDDFKKRAIQIHGDKYIYDKSVFVHYSQKIIITCKVHGDFEQISHGHLEGRGCSQCQYSLTTEEFIQKVKEVHGDI